VPPSLRDQATEELRGYNAHIEAMDDGLATVLGALDAAGIADDTIVVLTSDHGDMTMSQGLDHKLMPFDESIRVPFLLRWPRVLGRARRDLPLPLDAPDLLPTLCGLCGVTAPARVEGRDYSEQVLGRRPLAGDEAALLTLPVPFTNVLRHGMKAWRGVRTARHTYVRNLDGPWLLFDNEADPYQMRNLIGRPEAAAVQRDLEALLQARLAALGDRFEPAEVYLQRAGLTHYREVDPARWPAQPWRSPWE